VTNIHCSTGKFRTRDTYVATRGYHIVPSRWTLQ